MKYAQMEMGINKISVGHWSASISPHGLTNATASKLEKIFLNLISSFLEAIQASTPNYPSSPCHVHGLLQTRALSRSTFVAHTIKPS